MKSLLFFMLATSSAFATEATAPTEIEYSAKTISLGGGWFNYWGELQRQGDFSGDTPYFSTKFSHAFDRGVWLMRTRARLDVLHFQSTDLNEIVPRFSLTFASMKKTSKHLQVGPGIGLKKDFYLVSDANRKDSLQFSYLPIAFIAAEYFLSKNNTMTLDVGLNFPSHTEDGLTISPRPFVSFFFNHKFADEYFYQAELTIEDRQVDDLNQYKKLLGLHIGKFF